MGNLITKINIISRQHAISVWNRFIFIFAIGFLLGGCTWDYTNPNLFRNPAQSGKARIVFAAEWIGGLYVDRPMDIFEVNDNNILTMIGRLKSTTYFVYELEPGKHIFMSYRPELFSKDTQFMMADVLPDKVYYVRFVDGGQLTPIPISDKNLQNIKKLISTFTRTGSKSDGWGLMNSENASSFMQPIQARFMEDYPDWLKKPEYKKLHLYQEEGE